jgi:SARP family transcriptional regulator, regulator of embCAB operon
LRFNVLGRFEFMSNGRICTPSAPKVRRVLAVLTVRAGQTVSIDSLIEELWEGMTPKSAVTTTQTYIYQIRKMFEREVGERMTDQLLVTRSPGYSLEVDESQIDATMFTTLVARGRQLFEQENYSEASKSLHEALNLWTGPALSNVASGPVLRSHATHLDEQRITALELRIAADLQLGKHRELIAELKSLVAMHPFDEWLHAQLITSLERSGRRGEALRAYQELRKLLNDELGLDPSAELQQAHMAVLSSDTAPMHPLGRLSASVRSN